MVFDGVSYRDSDSIALHWGQYFKNLYTDEPKPQFDMEFKENVESFVNEIKRKEVDDIPYLPFYLSDIVKHLKFLKTGKACASDLVYNEHILYGGKRLHEILAQMFNYLYKYSYVPVKLKKWLIITLFKGGRKRKKMIRVAIERLLCLP